MLQRISILLFVGFLMCAQSAHCETCTGIAPTGVFATTTPGYSFVNCPSLCGTDLAASGYASGGTVWPPNSWGWTTVTVSDSIFMWAWVPLANFIMAVPSGVTSFQTTTAALSNNKIFQSGTPNLFSWIGSTLNTTTGWKSSFATGMVSVNPTVGSPSKPPNNTAFSFGSTITNSSTKQSGPLMGISVGMSGTSFSDLYLQTNQRVIQVSGGELEKCAYGKDGVNEPFIFVFNRKIWVGWILGTPTSSGMTYGYTVGSFPLQAGETAQQFNLSSTGSNIKLSQIIEYSSIYVDSGIQVSTNNKSFGIAGQFGTATSPLRRFNQGQTMGVALVPITNPFASPFRIKTKNGISALRAYP